MKLGIIVLALGLPSWGLGSPLIRPLDDGRFEAIMFKNIPQTRYKLQDGTLSASVDSSAGAWVQAWKTPLPVKTVRWQWQADGRPAVRDAKHEASKTGDDSIWRIGLLLSGPKPFVPFFAPAWIKQVAAIMHHPSDRMLYLVTAARHAAGQTWKSPYSDSIENRSVPSADGPDAWQTAEITFPEAQTLVGIWLMADGDDTRSRFEARLRALELVRP